MRDGLKLDKLTICKGADTLVSVDTCVAPGEVVSIMGPSGAGKSTLLAAIIGTLAEDFTLHGRVLLGGRDVTREPPEGRRIGILFQDDLLFPHLSVAANLAFGLRPGADRKRLVEEALAEVGLEGFGPRDPATLSGGQKARVALMRMLLSEPEALLLDEPFSRLDADRRAQMRTLVFGRARERGLPVLLVTHDAEDAQAAGGRIIRIG
ncbi:ATP-binding cassette domain-containing protein [Pontivivens ytuae]|uniref:ATP-binding cassette domain-containing protein n=1 Tax=Pontivivens ytuae TaxID=2789856 RepID=A0A7S9QC14_9RHOB|nr:ATP-binding cassette domain-containing protein [Pontivivens ytuae]QPH52912.1 ATP-binding cassette domain-containing protein [Pontivivens ytuae]